MMVRLRRMRALVPLMVFLAPALALGQIKGDQREKCIKNLFFNPKVGSEEIRKVVVLPLRSAEEGEKQATEVTDLLVTHLRTVHKYEILPPQDLNGLVRKRGMDRRQIDHYTHAVEVGKSLGVDGVLMGSLSQFGRMGGTAQFGLNLRMIRIPGGDTAWSLSCSARGKPKELQGISRGGIESIVRTLVQRWQSDKAIIAWGINLEPLKISSGRRKITLRVPRYREADIEEYIVARSTSESGPYTVLKRLNIRRRASASFKDGDVQAGQSYFYRYRVLTKQGFLSPFSAAIEARVGKGEKRKAQPQPRRQGDWGDDEQ